MGTPNKRKATYAEIEALPEHMVGEILDGDLVVSPRPRARHGLTATGLASIVTGAFQFGNGGPGGWWIIAEPELHLDEDVVVPDIAGWRQERMDSVPDVVGVELPPDWVCEVISPSTRRYDRGPKMRIYKRSGVPWLWIVDRASRAIEVYQLTDGEWRDPAVFEGVDRARLPPFEAIEIHLVQIWGE
jgi:Uma2 family endonuclease